MSFVEDVRWMRDYGITRGQAFELWQHPTERRDYGGNHPALLYLKDIEVTFAGFKALDLKEFYVNRGELRFLIGPNGAGKTTLLDVVCRKVNPTHGSIYYDGFFQLKDFTISEVARLGICRKFQTPSIFPDLTVQQNMELACPGNRSVLSGLRYKLSREARNEMNAMADLIGVAEYLGLPAKQLSHGQKQWLEIGLTLLQKPKLLMVDEPVAGMSEKERYATGLLLREASRDCAVLVVEHDMQFVREFSNIVSVLHEGRIIAEGNFDTVARNPQVVDVYLGRGGAEADSTEANHA